MSTTSKTQAGITLLPYSERVKLVRDRLRSLRFPRFKDIPKPAKVVAAEKTVREWRDRNEAEEEKFRAKCWEQRHAIEDALILGDTAKALALLKALEA